jgi:DNA-binding MarR family transcriptional regulator
VDLKKLDLIDLISERHVYIRSYIEKLWNEQQTIKMNNTEWHVLAKLYSGLDTIADVTKEVHVSRQATHKLIKNLELKMLIEIYDDQKNKKIKKVRLTQQGVHAYEKYVEIKSQVEYAIQSSIGSNIYEQLKKGLSKEWPSL